MLKGVYSHINHFSKFILLVTLVFSFLLFSTLLGILVLVPFYGSDILVLLTSPDYTDVSAVNAMKILQILNMTGGLLLPAVIYLWLCTPGIRQSFKAGLTKLIPVLFLSVLLILVSQPFIGWTNEINSHLTLPGGLSNLENWMKNTEQQAQLITNAFLSTTSWSGLLVNIFMIAVLPAFAEEILFRGAIAGLLKDWTRNIHIAVFLSSLLFAAFHLQFYGFLPRFLLGEALGYLYFWSGSLWLPIVAHFTNNFLSVLIEFMYRNGYLNTNAENFGMDSAVWLTAISIVCITGILFIVYKFTFDDREKDKIKPLQPR